MAPLLKVSVQWTGFFGAPGYSNFFWHEVDPAGSFDGGAFAAADKVNAFFTSIKAFFPPSVRWKVQSDVPIIEETTGEMIDIANAGARTEIVSTGINAGYSAASGAVITWRTSGVRNGRRVRGRTFLVPGNAAMMGTDGTLDVGAVSTFQTAANALIAPDANRSLMIWARPTAPGATDGIAHTVLSASIPDKAAILKSRRD